MQPATGVIAKSLPAPLRLAAEQLLGRSLQDDEVVGVFAYRLPTASETASPLERESEWNALVDAFPQQPLLSDEAISRESAYTREDESL